MKDSHFKIDLQIKAAIFIYLLSLTSSSIFIKSNYSFKFGRNLAEWLQFYCI